MYTQAQKLSNFNPFTAQACEISGRKVQAHARKQLGFFAFFFQVL